MSPLWLNGDRAVLSLRFHAAERSVLLRQLPHYLRLDPVGSPVIISHRGKTPFLAPDAFLAPTATLIGHVEIGEQASVWFGTVLRADKKELSGSSLDWIQGAAEHYRGLAREYMEEG